MKTFLTLIFIISFLSSSNAQETYKNDTYNFEIEFPDFFEEKEEDRDDMHIISLSSMYKNMILLASIFDYNKNIPEDEYNLKELESLVVTADAFKSKFKVKKLTTWKVGSYEGYRNPIKGKIAPKEGKKISYYGCMYVLVMGNGLEFRITILAQSKKYYLKEVEQVFVESFILKG